MKRVVAILAVCAGLILLPAVVLAADDFSATLSGANEIPPVTTNATGSATVNIITDSEVTEINYKVTYSGLSGPAVAAHIHLGGSTENGGVLLPLTVGPSPMEGTLKDTDLTPTGSVSTFAQAIDAIRAGKTYVNVHTAANPGGEIRGQLKPILNTATETPVPPAPSISPALVLALAIVLGLTLAWLRPMARSRSR